MAYPRTGSILDSTTHTALSTQIIIMVNNEPVGAVQNFAISQSRPNKRVGEIGTAGTIEIVPEGRAEVTLRVSRLAFDGLSATEAFSRAYRIIEAQRIPFDIIVIDIFTGTGDNAIITTFHNCWFGSIGKAYDADNYTIMEDLDIDVEYITETRGGEALALSQGVGGGRQVAFDTDIAEMQATTGRRGALDFEGLISAAY